MQQQRKLARGCKFQPTDEELVTKFLYKKITGGMSSCYEPFVMDVDLYGKEEPWQIWERYSDKDDQYDFEEDLYFFTYLKKKSANGNGYRINRTVGSSGGSWHGEDTGSRIEVDDDEINEEYLAIKRRFSYANRRSNQHKCWTMHEYSVEPISGQNRSKINNYCVLCRLRKKGGSSVPSPAAVVEAIAWRNHKRKPSTAAQIIMVADDDPGYQYKKRKALQTDNTIEQEQQQLAGSITVINIDDDDDDDDGDADDDQYCFSSGTTQCYQTEACLRVEQEQPKPNCVLEASAEYEIFGELGLCVPDDELFAEGARLFEDFDQSISGEGSLNTNCVLEARAEDVFEELGLCVSDDFFERAARLFHEINGNYTGEGLRVEQEPKTIQLS